MVELRAQVKAISEQVGQTSGATDRTPREGTRPTTAVNAQGQGGM